MREFLRTFTDADLESLGQLSSQVFNVSPARWETWKQRVPREHHRLIRDQHRIRAGLGFYAVSQWFGGRPVPMGGLALVCVDPAVRGSGLASQLVSHTLADLRREGLAISTLFPSTQNFYRKLGFEQAGMTRVFEQPLGVPWPMASMPKDVQPIEPLSGEPFTALAEARARRSEGNLQRNEGLWSRLLDAPDGDTPVRGYLVGPADAAEGYLIFDQRRGARPLTDTLVVHDMTAETPAAVRTIWSFLYGHRSTVKSVVWPSACGDPLLLGSQESDVQVVRSRPWMLRVLDVPAALEARGYRAQLDVDLHLDVDDDVLPENAGRWTLNVQQGTAQVERGGRGELKLTAQGLAALYSGMFRAEALQAAGRLDGSPHDLTRASQLFCGSEPWMADQF